MRAISILCKQATQVELEVVGSIPLNMDGEAVTWGGRFCPAVDLHPNLTGSRWVHKTQGPGPLGGMKSDRYSLVSNEVMTEGGGDEMVIKAMGPSDTLDHFALVYLLVQGKSNMGFSMTGTSKEVLRQGTESGKLGALIVMEPGDAVAVLIAEERTLFSYIYDGEVLTRLPG